MNILVVGGGGREHALVWKISKSPKVSKIYCAPGNGGISDLAECIDIKATDINGIVDFAEEKEIDLVVVAPDDPLAMGMVDELTKRGIRAFGPNKRAAIIEGSKVFSKNFMKKYNIPTADFQVFDNREDAIYFLKHCNYPVVIKADGLALGKGVIIANDLTEAKKAVDDCMINKTFGKSGERIVIEEFLEGPEVSILCFTDGTTIVPMPSAQDHKRVYDGDRGPNTGGMGAFSPSIYYTEEIEKFCIKNIFIPTIEAMKKEDRLFKGVLYFGLMLTDNGPKVLEYNARFGDPETQALLPLLETDIVEIFEAIIDERLHEIDVVWQDKSALCVILASGGYPKKYEKGYEIKGIEDILKHENIFIFHSGTKKKNGKYYTAGGRVLGITAVGDNLESVYKTVYSHIEKIKFKDMHYRKDIGKKV
ncbi:MAG TPA: phosphoribosylamine--glycine ligase [Clostridiales bacterium]|nr:phosphoribosylamine--glycine ligase [Clostridiales bacterium]